VQPLILGIPHLLYFGVQRPYEAWRSRHACSRAERHSRIVAATLHATVVQLATLGANSLAMLVILWMFSSRDRLGGYVFVFGHAVSSARGVWSGLFPLQWPSVGAWLYGALAYVVMVGIDLPFSRRCIERGERHSHFSMPQTRSERLWWIGLSVAAGVGEELTWRGVQPELIAQITGALWPAVLLVLRDLRPWSYQPGWRWAMVAGAFGLLFHALVWLTGSLYVAIVVHVAVNVTVGLYSGVVGTRVGYGLSRT
jgi:membrane protease YdiL (CAAX protease family)